MAIVLDDSPMRPITAEEAMRMVEYGIIGDGERVELLLGGLWRKAVKSPAHEDVKAQLLAWLYPRIAGARVRVEGPLAVPDGISLPEPDIAVVEPGDYREAHP